MNNFDQSSPENSRQLRVVVGNKPHQVESLAVFLGRDLVVIIGGGSLYHIGATAVAHALPSIKDISKRTSTASVITLPGHKEDEIARSAALRLASEFNCTVTVIAGLHIDQAEASDIQLLVDNFSVCIQELLVRLEDQQE